MATATTDTTRLREQIKSLELDDIAIEREVRKGLLTIEEGKKRKAEIDTQRSKISKELQHAETETPHDEKKHKDDKHEKEQLIPNKQTEEAEADTVTSPTSSSTTEVTENISTTQPTTTITASPGSDSPSTSAVNLTPAFSSSTTQDVPIDSPPQNQTPKITYSEPKPTTLPLNTQSSTSDELAPTIQKATSATEIKTAPFAVQPPTPIAKRTILKAIGKAALQKTGSVYKYTPLGFLVGQLDLGEKEREFAKNTTKTILSAPKTLTKASSNAAKTGALTALKYTPGGLLWEHLVPESIKTNIKAALHTNFIKNPPLKIDIKGTTKSGGKKAINNYSKFYKYTPLGLIWKSFVPKSTQDMLGGIAKNPKTITQNKFKEVKNKQTQVVKSASKSVFGKYASAYKKYTPLGLLYKAIPEDKKQKAKKSIKSAKEYQKAWNKGIVSKALKKGYDRLGLLQKIRNSKVWQSKAWKYGKYAVSPLGAAMYDRKQYLKKQNQKVQSGQTLPPSKLRSALQGKNPYAEWTSPKSLSNKFWNKAWNKFGTPGAGNVNNALGRKIGNKAGGKAAKKVGQQLAKKAVQTAVQTGARALIFNPVTLGFIGIAVLVLIAAITLIIIISSIMGGGDSGGGNGNDEENNGNTPVANPIPGFTLTLTGPPSINTCGDTSAPECVIEYSATYSQPQQGTRLDTITVYNDLPTNTEFVSAGPTAEYDANAKRVSWKLSDTTNASPLIVRLRPTQNNIRVNNTVYALATPAGGGMIAPPSDSLVATFEAAAREYNVPSALTRAIAKTESGAHDTYSNDDFTTFNQSGWFTGLADDAPTKDQLPELIQRGYAYNTCAYPKSNPICPGSDVRGITQFLNTTWDSVKDRIPTISGASGDRRYATDAVYGQARHTRDIIERYDGDFGFSNNPTDFTEAQVRAIAISYCAGNPFANINVPACSNTSGTYDTKVWNFYQEIRATQNQ